MYNFEALNDKDRHAMLNKIGVNSIEDLYSVIPDEVKMPFLDLNSGTEDRKSVV